MVTMMVQTKRTRFIGRRQIRLRPMVIIAIIAAVACLPSCSDKDTGGEDEVFKGIAASIKELNPENEQQLEDLARIVRERSFKDIRKLVEIMHGEDQDAADKAAALLQELDDLPAGPILEALDMEDPEMMIWEMQQVVSRHAHIRSRIVAKLEEMLKDKTPLPSRLLPDDVEEMPVERRVCDEAYLMLRSLMALEDSDTKLANSDVFLDMSDEERDEEIERVRKSGEWITLRQSEDY